MNRRKLIIIFIFATLIASLISSFILAKKQPKEVHIHAGFVVFENNKQKDFSDFRYMKISPCNTSGHSEELVDEQLEKAHLHDQIGDIVHVHRENAKWDDLFENINYEIDYDIVLTLLNGDKITDFKNLNIRPYDSLVILVGENDEKTILSNAVKKAHIQEVEKRSENCGS